MDSLFEKLKTRLVAGGDQQDKELYENLSSPTASTSSVLVVVAIAATEHRQVMTIDVWGTVLNADITATRITVQVCLDPEQACNIDNLRKLERLRGSHSKWKIAQCTVGEVGTVFVKSLKQKIIT